MIKRYLEIGGESNEQQEALNNFLSEGDYNYAESPDPREMYARYLSDDCVIEGENELRERKAMVRLPEHMVSSIVLEQIIELEHAIIHESADAIRMSSYPEETP